jgi:predicted transcriptional regulator
MAETTKKRDQSEEALVKLFGSTSRARILSLLLGTPGVSFYQREIMYETGLSLQAVQRELVNLVNLEIVERQGTPNKVYYRVRIDSPFFKPLKEIFGSSTGEAGSRLKR